MNILKKLITIFIVLFIFIPTCYSQDQIVYLDLDNVVNSTKAGKIILNKLEKSKNNALLKFKNKEQELKKIESEINKQKNIISDDELKKKLVEFRKELSIFRQERQNVINGFNQKKKKNLMNSLKKLHR